MKSITNIFKKNKGGSKITAVNLYWKGSFHSLEGFEIDGETFNVTIPFTNHTGSELSFLKESKNQETVSDIKTADPFEIESIEPALPKSLAPNEHVDFKITLKAPNYSYSGPLTLRFFALANPDLVNIGIPKIVLIKGDKKVEMEDDRHLANFVKNQIFEIPIQMYKILTYNEEVKEVIVREPFKFVKCDKKIPFKIDDPDSYVVSYSIQVPEYSYSGPLEIEFK